MLGTRKLTAALALGFLALIFIIDLAGGAAPNPYRAPALFALGSGQVASGGLCAALPPR